MEAKVNRGVNKTPDFFIDPDHVTSNMESSYFAKMVERAKQHIYEGDIFQVVLSQRFETEMSGDTFMLYRALRMVNPSPYLFYLDFDSFTLVGSSPEVLVSVQDQRVRVLPIAGTRKRGATVQEDLQLEADLKQDPKEIAEHIMLVDLGRNDVSRVCKPGSVHLDRNQVIERYSHVMHIVSDVSGQLAEGKTAVDALMQCFPAGTVSGAPKIRAMQIIDEMEPTKRGIYAGAVGYFDYSGNMDTCIAIRTMVVTGNKVYIQAGAGIVADSVAENEFEETVNKAGALVKALSTALDIRDN
jgi:anthranilate synthase component I